MLGELARHAQDLSEAEQHFSKAIKLDPNFGEAYLGLGMTLVAEKKFSEAVSPLETAVKAQPGNPAAHYSLATAYARTGRKQDAEREFALQQKTSGTQLRASRRARIRSDPGFPPVLSFAPRPQLLPL